MLKLPVLKVIPYVALSVVAFLCGYLIGITPKSQMRVSKANIGQLDNNGDGRIDTEFNYHEDLLTGGRYDRNFDGEWDYWEWYANGQIQRAEADNNFDRKVDSWLSHKHGNIVESRHDLDNNGKADSISSYRHGIILLSVGRPNGLESNAWVEFFREGSLWKELRDRNGDGLLDWLVEYDWFGSTVIQEEITPPIEPGRAIP